MKDFKISIDDQGMGKMSLEQGNPLLNKIYLSLNIQKGTYFLDTSFGSRLYLLHRAKNTERTEKLLKDYIKQALKWLIDTAQIKTIEIYTEREKYRIKYRVKAISANNDVIEYENFIEVK